MDLFMIRRNQGWKTPEELEAAAKRSTEVAEADFPDSIRWIRSYVVAEPNGDLGTVCIYEAADADAVRAHAAEVGMPSDEVLPIVDTVIVRPDPEKAAA
jgi:Nickel responsive protein SCO4226-like